LFSFLLFICKIGFYRNKKPLPASRKHARRGLKIFFIFPMQVTWAGISTGLPPLSGTVARVSQGLFPPPFLMNIFKTSQRT